MSDKYELDYTPQDIGEFISLVRVSYARLNTLAFSREIGLKEKVLIQAEEGMGMHVETALKKTIKRYHKKIKVKLICEIS